MIIKIFKLFITFEHFRQLSQYSQVNNNLELLRIFRNSHKFSLVF